MGELAPVGITKAALIKAAIGEDYWSCDFQNYIGPQSAKVTTKHYLKDLENMKSMGIGLIFGGPVGSGKTTLASITLKYLIRAGWSCYSTSLGEIVEQLQKSWSEDNDFIETCKEVQFLLIDDLGKEHIGPSGFAHTVFDNVLRHRIHHRLPTLFTTNLTSGLIKHRYGDALLSLVTGKCVVVETKAEDVRTTLLKAQL